MHVVDYWAGIPLCLAVSVYDAIRRRLAPRSDAGPQRMLLIELSEMGSAVLAYPALEEAAARLGPENVWFLIFERNREGVAVLDLIPDDHILTVNDRSFAGFLASTLRALAACRSKQIDTAIDLELFSRCTALLSYLCGARLRSGFSAPTSEGLYRGSFFTHPVPYSPHHHMTRAYLALVRAPFGAGSTGGDLPEDPSAIALPAFRPTPEVAERVDAVLTGVPRDRRLVFFNPDAGLLPLRAWPAQHFAALAGQLLKAFPDVIVGVVGVERSRLLADEILAGLPADRALNLAGRTRTLFDLLEVLSRGSALVTIDSGPAHFSGLTPIPRIVLFGPETPLLYRPAGARVDVAYANIPCSPCFSAANHRTSACTDNQCLKQISPDHVFGLVREILEPGARAVSIRRSEPTRAELSGR